MTTNGSITPDLVREFLEQNRDEYYHPTQIASSLDRCKREVTQDCLRLAANRFSPIVGSHRDLTRQGNPTEFKYDSEKAKEIKKLLEELE